VLFGTPFEAVLSQRVSTAQAGRVKEALSSELGTRMEIGGEEHVAFPGPAALASLDEFPGVWASKLERIRGIGPFAATLVLARGAGHPDVPPPTLRRFRQAVASAYGLDHEPDEVISRSSRRRGARSGRGSRTCCAAAAARVWAVLRLW
jgi:DNA-3-methyladenine glycosylase II